MGRSSKTKYSTVVPTARAWRPFKSTILEIMCRFETLDLNLKDEFRKWHNSCTASKEERNKEGGEGEEEWREERKERRRRTRRRELGEGERKKREKKKERREKE